MDNNAVVEVLPMYYMRDNHTFKPLAENVEFALTELRQQIAEGWTSGSLFSRRDGAPATLHCDYSDTEGFFASARPWLEACVAAGVALKQSLAQPAQEDQDVPEAIRLLGLLMDGWEDGIACYEDPEECAGYLGSAFKLDDETFDACCNLLNRRKPPRGTVLKNGMLIASQPSAPVSQPMTSAQRKEQTTDWCPHCGQGWQCAEREQAYRIADIERRKSSQPSAPVMPEGYKLMPIEPTHEILSAMAASKARDDEGEFPMMLDLLDYSGENKTHTVLKAAYAAAIASRSKP